MHVLLLNGLFVNSTNLQLYIKFKKIIIYPNIWKQQKSKDSSVFTKKNEKTMNTLQCV